MSCCMVGLKSAACLNCRCDIALIGLAVMVSVYLGN